MEFCLVWSVRNESCPRVSCALHSFSLSLSPSSLSLAETVESPTTNASNRTKDEGSLRRFPFFAIAVVITTGRRGFAGHRNRGGKTDEKLHRRE